MPYNPPIRDQHRPARSTNPLASLVEAEKMMQVAILLPSSAFVGWIFGALLDKYLHQTWISLVGILFGGISGIVYVVRMVTAQTPKPGNENVAADDEKGRKASRD
jgi:ATP synthase protein I